MFPRMASFYLNSLSSQEDFILTVIKNMNPRSKEYAFPISVVTLEKEEEEDDFLNVSGANYLKVEVQRAEGSFQIKYEFEPQLCHVLVAGGGGEDLEQVKTNFS